MTDNPNDSGVSLRLTPRSPPISRPHAGPTSKRMRTKQTSAKSKISCQRWPNRRKINARRLGLSPTRHVNRRRAERSSRDRYRWSAETASLRRPAARDLDGCHRFGANCKYQTAGCSPHAHHSRDARRGARTPPRGPMAGGPTALSADSPGDPLNADALSVRAAGPSGRPERRGRVVAQPGHSRAALRPNSTTTSAKPIASLAAMPTPRGLSPGRATRSEFRGGPQQPGHGPSRPGTLRRALACYERAIACRPDYAIAHYNRGFMLLLMARWAEGWPEYEWHWRCSDMEQPAWRHPAWDGSPLAGRTILLYAEQGLGDTLQFVRFAPLVKQRGGSVLLHSPRKLLSCSAHALASTRSILRTNRRRNSTYVQA